MSHNEPNNKNKEIENLLRANISNVEVDFTEETDRTLFCLQFKKYNVGLRISNAFIENTTIKEIEEQFVSKKIYQHAKGDIAHPLSANDPVFIFTNEVECKKEI